MRKILPAAMSLAVLWGASTGTAHASFSSSTSGSCSETLDDWGYFYAYTYQYAYVDGGVIESESHSFSFSGFLDGGETATLLRSADNKWAIYRAGVLELAVPYISGAGLYMRDVGGPVAGEWIQLCDY
ncbi:hypothetical protein [Nocardia sp. BMG111209]|uniref:hypothetical protein n=1 Tax=Nocardia sp. BMG111209 TaxID=1160137 RepID=UPI00036F4601|nr:hypothetical protein [Nocardia sp. BMG111209]